MFGDDSIEKEKDSLNHKLTPSREGHIPAFRSLTNILDYSKRKNRTKSKKHLQRLEPKDTDTLKVSDLTFRGQITCPPHNFAPQQKENSTMCIDFS